MNPYDPLYQAMMAQHGMPVLMPHELAAAVPDQQPPATSPPFGAMPPAATRFREGQSEWAKTDAIRWGDEDQIAVSIVVFAPVTITQTSKQLARCNVPRPVAWLVQLNASAVMATGEVAPVDVSWEFSVGCGQSRTTYETGFVTLTAANGYKLPFGSPPPQVFVPASDLQIRGKISFTPTVPGSSTLLVGAMVAPFTRWD